MAEERACGSGISAGASYPALVERLTAVSSQELGGADAGPVVRPEPEQSVLEQDELKVKEALNQVEQNASLSLNQGTPIIGKGKSRRMKIRSGRVRKVKKTETDPQGKVMSRRHFAVWTGTSLSASLVRRTEEIPPQAGETQSIEEEVKEGILPQAGESQFSENLEVTPSYLSRRDMEMEQAMSLPLAGENVIDEVDELIAERHTGAPINTSEHESALVCADVQGSTIMCADVHACANACTGVHTCVFAGLRVDAPYPGRPRAGMTKSEEVMTGEKAMRFDSGVALGPCATGANSEQNTKQNDLIVDSQAECSKQPQFEYGSDVLSSETERKQFPTIPSLLHPSFEDFSGQILQPLNNDSRAECSMNVHNTNSKNILGPRGPSQMPQKRKSSAASMHELHLEQVINPTSELIGFNHLPYVKGEKAGWLMDLPGPPAPAPIFNGS